MAKLVKACQVWTHTSQASVLPHPLLFDSGSRQGRTCKGAQEHRVIICHNSLLVQVQNNMGHPHESHDEMCLCHLSGAWHDKHNTYRWKFATTIAERLFPNAPPSKPSAVPSRRKNSRKNGLHIFFSSAFERVIEYTLLSLSMTNSAPSTGEVWARAIKARQSRGPSWICCDDNVQWPLFRFFSLHAWIFPKLLRYRLVSTPLLFLRQLASCLFYAEGHSL